MSKARNNRDYADTSKEDRRASGEESIHESPDNVMSDHEEDERLSSQGRTDTRLQESREVNTRENHDDAERIAAFRDSIFSAALPPLPKIEGYHICWLTTTNPRDSIASRERLGYELIRVEEIPAFAHSSLKTGPFAGCIGVEEMVAAKLPLRLFHAYMNEAHHNAPLSEEKRLKAVTEVIAEQAKAESGKEPVIGDGTAALGKGPSRGKFQE